MEWLSQVDWNFVVAVLAVIAFVVFMFKGGCGSAIGRRGRLQEGERESREPQRKGQRDEQYQRLER